MGDETPHTNFATELDALRKQLRAAEENWEKITHHYTHEQWTLFKLFFGCFCFAVCLTVFGKICLLVGNEGAAKAIFQAEELVLAVDSLLILASIVVHTFLVVTAFVDIVAIRFQIALYRVRRWML